MPLPSPDLDDRTFAMLVDEARQLVMARAPGWTDLSAGDPGITLLEAFAYLADTTIFRLNQVPDKLYVEFLRLIGARIQPPPRDRWSCHEGPGSPSRAPPAPKPPCSRRWTPPRSRPGRRA